MIPQIYLAWIFNAIKEYNLTSIINQIGYKKYLQVLNPGLNGTSAKKCPIWLCYSARWNNIVPFLKFDEV